MEKKLWKYKLYETQTVVITDPELLSIYGQSPHIYYREWFTLSINSDSITLIIRKDYSWDGCTPKFNVGNRMLGVWDGLFNLNFHQQDTYNASMVHDVLCQFRSQHPLRREDVDKIFLYMLQRDKFALAWVYYLAVKYVGSFIRNVKESNL